MSDIDTAVDGANPAAPVPEVAQEPPQISANAEVQDETPPDDKPRDEKGRFVQERINELTKARRQAERERDALAHQVESLRSQHQTPPPSEKAPTPADFQYDLDAWAVAHADHVANKAREGAAQEFAQRQQQQSQAQVFAQYEAREKVYAVSHPGYADALDALKSSVQLHPSVVEVMAHSDHGPAIVEHLGTHLDEADRISRLPPHLAAYELARIEAKVSAPKPKPVSAAPSPPPALGGGSVVKKDPERMTDAEFAAWRRSQISQRGQG